MIKRAFAVIIIFSLVIIGALYGYNWYTYGTLFVKEANTDNQWETMLVNNKHRLDKDYEPECVKLANGERVDERIYPELQNMFDDARREGISITVRSGYRSWYDQDKLWEEEMDRLDEEGITRRDAIRIGELMVQRPGMSEHQTGLAVDINSQSGEDSSVLYRWLQDYSCNYGFVLRYPEDKIEITGISYEPWHYRYVGIDAAKVMKDKDICLEEYVERYE